MNQDIKIDGHLPLSEFVPKCYQLLHELNADTAAEVLYDYPSYALIVVATTAVEAKRQGLEILKDVPIDEVELGNITEAYWAGDDVEYLKDRLLTELDCQAPEGYEFCENDLGEFGFWESI
jgi:hypothetical protein